MSAEQFITEHLDLWTGAVTTKSTGGRGSQNGIELTGIKKLRELIADLAVRGKLLQQEPTDESASNLAIKIAAEREQLVKTGAIKRLKRLPQIDVADQPYCLPPNWAWIRLGEATNYGITEKAEPNDVSGETWVLELEDIEKESSRLVKKIRQDQRPFKSSKNRFQKNDVLYGKLRPYLDKVVVADECGVCTTEIVPLRGFYGLAPDYLQLALKSPAFKNYANSSTHGMNLPRLGTDKARLALLPLPPENEQHRIVQKVDELMALCDRLEQQTCAQHAAHETLVDALLDTLTQSKDADELSENWARLAAHFDTLFTTEHSIERLERCIRQLGIAGRLVPQNLKDEPTSELLEKIAKSKSLKKKSNSKSETLPISEAENLDVLPNNWKVVRLGEIAFQITDGAHHTPTYVTDGIPFLSVKDVSSGRLDFSNTRYISKEQHDELSRRCHPERGDLLLTKVGTTGIPVLIDVNKPFSIFVSVALIKFDKEYVDGRYLELCMSSPYVKAQCDSGTEGVGNKNLVLRKIRNLAIPLPPLNEQHRIVWKVNELMITCEKLKSRLNNANDTGRQMAQVVIERAIQ